MKKTMFLGLLIGSLFGTAVGQLIREVNAHTGSPTFVTWSTGQTLTSTDLNNALAHIHNTLSGGITDTHINTAAAIAHTKMATPALLPKAWVIITNCTATPCTIQDSVGVTAVSRTGTGAYTATLTTTRTGTYPVFITPVDDAADTVFCVTVDSTTTSAVNIKCYDHTGVAQDTALSMMVLDT